MKTEFMYLIHEGKVTDEFAVKVAKNVQGPFYGADG